MEILNRTASFNYFIEEKIECGIVLVGTEVKSIRNGKANIKDCYGIVRNNEIFLINMHISHYDKGNIFNHDENKPRKLLLHKNEIKKIKNKLDLDGYSLIPIKLYFKNNRVKVLLGICKGKKLYDKRETIKKRDQERELRQNIKYRY